MTITTDLLNVYLKRTLYFIKLYFEDAQPELMILLYTLFLDITRITELLISYYRQNIRDDEILFHHSDLFDKRTGRVLLWKLWKSIYVYLLNCKEIAFAAAAHIILFGML